MFSVIIPVYEAKKSLERCVDSWLAQTERNLELVLVDDGSSDGSGELCDRLAARDKRVRVIHQENAGVSAARNTGIGEADGDFVLFTDSDDYVTADYLEKMSAAQREADSDLVLCGFHHIYDGADILKVPGKTKTYSLEDFSVEFLELYEKSYLNMPWNKLFKRELLGVFDTSVSLGEDLLFNLDYLRKCARVTVLAEPLCCYIQEEGSSTLSSKKRGNRMELARLVCEKTERFYEETWGRPDGEDRIFARYMAEILDECTKLPSDKEPGRGEKLKIIRAYAADDWVKSRGRRAPLRYLDHRILRYFLVRDMPGMVYALCACRRAVVTAVHHIRRKKSVCCL